MADPEPARTAGPARPARWQIVRTDEFRQWTRGLPAERRIQVEAAIRRVASGGPQLGRPRVDSIKGSRLHNLKEVRINDGVRVLFAFDPNRRAVMLTGGNKTGRWDRWYGPAVARAERLYSQHLRSIGKEGRSLSRPGTTRNERTR